MCFINIFAHNSFLGFSVTSAGKVRGKEGDRSLRVDTYLYNCIEHERSAFKVHGIVRSTRQTMEIPCPASGTILRDEIQAPQNSSTSHHFNGHQILICAICLQNHDVTIKTNKEMIQFYKWLNGSSDIGVWGLKVGLNFRSVF